MTAGQTYDIRIEYFDRGGSATAQLSWSSPSTPEEIIDPAVNLGVNAVTYDYHVYADATKSGRPEWGDPNDYFGRPNVGTDFDGWPTADAGHIFWEGAGPVEDRRRLSASFPRQGRGDRPGSAAGDFVSTAPISARRYLPGPATTRAPTPPWPKSWSATSDLFGLTFRRTQRDGGAPENTGIRNVQLLRPIAPGSGTFYRPDDIFDRHVKDGVRQVHDAAVPDGQLQRRARVARTQAAGRNEGRLGRPHRRLGIPGHARQ